jgi:hypothetical protein
LPATVELGLHPDALDHPDDYDQLCTEQALKIQQLAGRPMRLVRNHGFQNRGYHGYVDVWQSLGLKLDVNYPGADGTALTGSFLPMRVRKVDKTWSEHYTLLTPFTDGMLYTLKLSEQEAVRRIRAVVRQTEASHPAALVFNLHPQNVADARKIHAAVLALARRRGWVALGLESYLDWLETLESLDIEPTGDRFAISSPRHVTGLVIRYPTSKGWQRRKLPQWSRRIEVSFP